MLRPGIPSCQIDILSISSLSALAVLILRVMAVFIFLSFSCRVRDEIGILFILVGRIRISLFIFRSFPSFFFASIFARIKAYPRLSLGYT